MDGPWYEDLDEDLDGYLLFDEPYETDDYDDGGDYPYDFDDPDFDSGSDFVGSRVMVRIGKLVERLSIEEQGSCAKDVKIVGELISSNLWLELPDEIMLSILSWLPFSSICSFRCVCKKWNALSRHTDLGLMVTRGSRELPWCVICIGSNEFACYSPSSHSWHQLPAAFGYSFGALGFSGDESRVVAGAGGLLVLQSLHMGLWVVNPINKSERRLPQPLIDIATRAPHFRGSQRASTTVHLHVNEGDSSYKVFVLNDPSSILTSQIDYGSPRLDICLQIYDSRSDSWDGYTKDDVQGFSRIMSTVEYEGDLCCLVCGETTPSEIPCNISVLKQPPEHDLDGQINANVSKFWRHDTFPTLTMNLKFGQLFVKDGNLMLAGVTSHDYLVAGHGCRASIWELYYDDWREIATMPVELLLFFKFDPHIAVQGDYLWIMDFCDDNERSLQFGENGVMCDMATDSWWRLPKFCDSPKLRLDTEQIHPYWELCANYSKAGTCPAGFFFTPRMDLVA